MKKGLHTTKKWNNFTQEDHLCMRRSSCSFMPPYFFRNNVKDNKKKRRNNTNSWKLYKVNSNYKNLWLSIIISALLTNQHGQGSFQNSYRKIWWVSNNKKSLTNSIHVCLIKDSFTKLLNSWIAICSESCTITTLIHLLFSPNFSI